MPLGNNQKLHAKQYFQTKNSKGYVRYGVEPDVISLTLHELSITSARRSIFVVSASKIKASTLTRTSTSIEDTVSAISTACTV